MPIRRRFSRRPIRTGRRRPTFEWANFSYSSTLNANTVDSANTPLGNAESTLGGDLVGWTIRRIIVNGMVCLTPGTTAETTPSASYQTYLYISQAEFTAFRADMWAANTLWLREGFVYSPGAVTTQALSVAGADRFELDLRAARRFKDTSDVLRLFVGNRTPTNDELRISMHFKFLLSHP